MPDEHEESIFSKISPEQFYQGAARLEAWALAPGNECQHIDILREAMEFKKLNNNLMDRVAIENLIADVYAWIYDRYVDELKAKETAEENRARMSVDTILMNPAPTPFINMGASMESTVGGEQQGRAARRQFSVTRRMVIGKAENLIVKPPAIATPRAAPRALAPAPHPNQSAAIAVVIPQEGKSVGEVISVPGSVHDSADDESELSDVEDLVEDPLEPPAAKKSPPKSLFPNLLGVNADEDDAESSIGEEGANTPKDEGEDAVEDAVENDVEDEDPEAESEAEKQLDQQHAPSDGLASPPPPQNGDDEGETAA